MNLEILQVKADNLKLFAFYDIIISHIVIRQRNTRKRSNR